MTNYEDVEDLRFWVPTGPDPGGSKVDNMGKIGPKLGQKGIAYNRLNFFPNNLDQNFFIPNGSKKCVLWNKGLSRPYGDPGWLL